MWRLNKTERSQGTLDNKKELRRQDEMMQKKAHKLLGIVDKPVEEEPPQQLEERRENQKRSTRKEAVSASNCFRHNSKGKEEDGIGLARQIQHQRNKDMERAS